MLLNKFALDLGSAKSVMMSKTRPNLWLSCSSCVVSFTFNTINQMSDSKQGNKIIVSLMITGMLMPGITVAQHHFQWASPTPDGGQIIYSKYKEGFADIKVYCYDLQTHHATILIDDIALTPKLSHNGKKLLYVDTLERFKIYDLTKRKTINLFEKLDIKGMQTPSWSADGNQIYFGAGDFPQISIYRYSFSSGKTEKLTSGGFDYGPENSPDGKLIAYRHIKIPERTEKGIWVMNTEGKPLRQLTDFGEYPTWASNKIILFQGKAANDKFANIYRVNVDGTGLKRLTHDTAHAEWPVYAAKAGRIFFQVQDNGKYWNIYAMSLEGEQYERLPL
jgi:Tol biopolymer transport system component